MQRSRQACEGCRHWNATDDMHFGGKGNNERQPERCIDQETHINKDAMRGKGRMHMDMEAQRRQFT